ncbi:MAG: hypothetical protein MR278_07600 [Bacteroidales bacterium]|nr:hypothetical protein [Anaerotignum sp.]MCI5679824.1 hypothetical protein [Bacteroidales bacterium]MDY3925818.1 hypothetical protein [Anaerotignum sp.]
MVKALAFGKPPNGGGVFFAMHNCFPRTGKARPAGSSQGTLCSPEPFSGTNFALPFLYLNILMIYYINVFSLSQGLYSLFSFCFCQNLSPMPEKVTFFSLQTANNNRAIRKHCKNKK